MLSAKENMRQCIVNGKPDRYVNQFEALAFVMHPYDFASADLQKGGPDVVTAWGVTYSFPENVPGGFPVHTPEKIVIKDIKHWREYVHAPKVTDLPEYLWETSFEMAAEIDDDKAFRCAEVLPGIFENTHDLCGMENALIYYMEYEEEMHDLIKYLTEWELELAMDTCDRLHPNAVLHHDDWGSETNSFFRPSVFEDYFLDAYKQIYGYYKSRGCEFVIHHADSYCANMVPIMIEMGIDVWQGCMHSNNVPELVKKYGDKMTFMGEIDNKFVDFEGWTPADCQKAAQGAIERINSLTGFIPCITQGGPGSVYPGAYMELTRAIDQYNINHFECTQEGLDTCRMPIKINY